MFVATWRDFIGNILVTGGGSITTTITCYTIGLSSIFLRPIFVADNGLPLSLFDFVRIMCALVERAVEAAAAALG